MGRLLIIMFSQPWQSENTNTVYEFARAAMEEGHDVTIFCDADATFNLMASQIVPDKATPTSKMAQLIKMGVKAFVCGESARQRGIDLKSNLVEGAVRSSLGMLTELMEQNDRIVGFG